MLRAMTALSLRVVIVVLVAVLAGCAGPAYEAGLRHPIGAPAGVEHREGRFDSWGLSLFEESWRPQGEPRAVVVIVHGLKDHADRYAELAERLVAKGFAVYAMDLRGHGDSEGDRVWVNCFDEYVADVHRYLDLVERREPNRPIYLFGHSMGGAIVTLVALGQRRLAGLVLSAPALQPTDDVSPALIGATKAIGSLFPGLAVFDLPDAKFSRDPKAVAALAADPLVYHGSAPAKTAASLLTAMERIGDRMERMFVPLLVLHGSADQLTNPHGSQELARRARSSDKSLKLYPGLAHDLWHEPEKEQVIADLLGWLDQRAPR